VAGVFLFYGFFSGLIVPRAAFFPASVLNYETFYDKIGVPVQLFRAACVVLITYSFTRVMGIFNWETLDSMRRTKEELERYVNDSTAQLKEANEKLELDLAKRRQIEEELRENENFLRAVIETEPECIKLLAPDGTLLMMNQAGLAMVGADSLDQVKGKSLYPLVLSEYREGFKTLTEEVFQGKEGKLEFEVLGLKGERLWLETYSVPLRNAKGEIFASLGITRNITGRKNADEQIIKALREQSSGRGEHAPSPIRVHRR